MGILIVKYWLLIVVGIVLFFGGLTHSILREIFIKKIQFKPMNQPGHKNRRKTRNVNKKKQTINTNSVNNDTKNDEEQKTISPDITIENDEEQENFENTIQTERTPPTHGEDEQEPTIVNKQRNTNKVSNSPSEKEEPVIPSKPQASVAPVKQAPLTPLTNDSSNHLKSSQNHNVKTNGHASPPHNIYTYSAYNPLPPRFQQQQQQQRQRHHREMAYNNHRHRRRRGGRGHSKRSSFPPDSAARPNDFVPLSLQQQQQQQQQQTEHYQVEPDVQFVQQQDLPINNGYSSESDIVTDPPSIVGNTSISPILSTSTCSQSSLQRLDLVRSLATSHGLLDELISIFDTTSFSPDELELILNKIATKHILDKHDLQRLVNTTKTDKSFERIIDETYRSQAKILAIELQTEKNRTLELTKSNADMENTIRQLLAQQPNAMIQYQQAILPFQMHIRRFVDENNRLNHQLHAYAMMPATLNELKQQNIVLSEQIRQMTIRNSALENEVAESVRASKHAAEVYKKADSQKQERIEQMIADINKYKKLDQELTNLRKEHTELEKNLNDKINEITNERDQLHTECNQLKDKLQEYEQLKLKYDQLKQNPTNHIEQKLNHLKTDNDQLKQSNWKNMEELNNLLNEQKQNQTS